MVAAGGAARPGVIYSLTGDKKPDHLTTVFAGFDTEAVAEARKHFAPFPPSSACVALFKDGELVHMLERHHIEGKSCRCYCSEFTSSLRRILLKFSLK